MDSAGFDTIWLAEAYPWWRKHGMEARSATVLSALIATRDRAARHRLGDHLALHAASGAGGDGRPGRPGGRRPGALLPRLRDLEDLPQERAAGRRRRSGRSVTRSRSSARVRRRGVEFEGRRSAARSPRSDEAHTPRDVPPIYIAATGPKMQAPPARSPTGCLTPAITTPAFVRYSVGNAGPRSTSAGRSSPGSTRTATGAGTGRARSRRCTSRTRCRTSRARPTSCSRSPS